MRKIHTVAIVDCENRLWIGFVDMVLSRTNRRGAGGRSAMKLGDAHSLSEGLEYQFSDLRRLTSRSRKETSPVISWFYENGKSSLENMHAIEIASKDIPMNLSQNIISERPLGPQPVQ